jgi:hypothetical protein
MPETKQATTPANINMNKAKLYQSDLCSAEIVEISNDGERLFRVAADDKCLSVGEGMHWHQQGMPLLFMPCDTEDTKQVFAAGHDEYEDGSFTVLDINGMCIDAASGMDNGPLAYPCHPREAQSRQQLFTDKNGKLSWIGLQPGMPLLCMDPLGTGPTQTLATFTICGEAGDGISPKPGQAFLKHDVQSDGSFQLQEASLGTCLTADRGGVIAAPCGPHAEQRWTQTGTSLKNVAEGLCLNAIHDWSIHLHACSDPYIRVLKIHENGWIEIPRSFADNGRVRYLARCLDIQPVDPVDLKMGHCSEAANSGTSWERVWEEVPLETRLFKEAADLHGYSFSLN